MSKNLFFAQDIKEATFIISNSPKSVCVPINLETYLFCIEKKIDYINLEKIIDTKFHKKALLASNKFTNKIKYTKKINDSLKNEIKCNMRNRFHSIFFLDEILKKIKKNIKIKNIYVSGWTKENHISSTEYIISDILQNLNLKKIIPLNVNKDNSKFEVYEYYFKKKKILNKKKKIYLANLGYNFSRFVLFAPFRKYMFFVPLFDEFSSFKKLVFNFFNVKFITFKKDYNKPIKNKKKLFSLNSLHSYSKILLGFKKKFQNYFEDLNQKINIIKRSNIDNNYDLILSNNLRATDGALLNMHENMKKQKSICISHGTITSNYNQYDEIYKRIISESVFSKNSNYNCAQSKIFTSFSKKNNHRNILLSGNLIFANAIKKKDSEKKNILVAVTLKGFENMQFYGVEMYYEFINNLSIYNNLAKKYNYNFIINVHPQEIKSIKKLRNLFPLLTITFKKVDRLLKNSFVTISYSSTVIEDSLYSKVPVILFDPFKRYKHCNAAENFNKFGESIYYIKNKKNLSKCIQNIKKTKNFNFDKYTYSYNVKQNINKNIFEQLK